eukprot:6190541-Pleurochrysis_carterae.AAC.3
MYFKSCSPYVLALEYVNIHTKRSFRPNRNRREKARSRITRVRAMDSLQLVLEGTRDIKFLNATQDN